MGDNISHLNGDPREKGAKPPFDRNPPQEPPGLEQQMIPSPDYGEESYVGSGRLKEKVAVITGGDSGIGRAVALAFAREGADEGSYINGEVIGVTGGRFVN